MNTSPKDSRTSDSSLFSNPRNQILLLILLSGFLFRVFVLGVLDGSNLSIVDETHYDEIAVHLTKTGNYGTDKEELISIRPPLYPYFLSKIYSIAGCPNYTAVRCCQIIISLATVLCVYGTARETGFLSRNSSLIAAGIFALYPSLVIQNFFILTETLFTFFLVLVLWTSLRFLRTGSLWAIAFCGILIALGSLTRSILWLSPIPLALFILFIPNKNPVFSWKRRTSAAFLLLLCAGLTMTPWILRNTNLQKTFTAIDCMSGRNLMMGNYENTPLYRAWDAISILPPNDWYTILKKDWSEKNTGSFDALSQGMKDREAGKYAKEFIKSHPTLTLQRTVMKSLCFWQLERSIPSGVQQGFWGLDRFSGTAGKILFLVTTVLVMFPFVLLFQCAIWGFFAVFSSKNIHAIALLLAVTLYFWVLHSIAFAHERYHLPLVPILILFAVYLFQNRQNALFHFQKSAYLIFPLFLSLLFIVFWGLEIYWSVKFI